jgi:hypothetical protein
MGPSCQWAVTVPGGQLTSRTAQRTGQQALPEELERAPIAGTGVFVEA